MRHGGFVLVREEGCGFGFSILGFYDSEMEAVDWRAAIEAANPRDSLLRLVRVEDPRLEASRPRRNGHNSNSSPLLLGGGGRQTASATPPASHPRQGGSARHRPPAPSLNGGSADDE